MARHAQPAMKMVQNSAFMMGSMVMTAGLGFLFWGLVAHLYSTERVGLATSLISAISLISYLGLLGFNNTVVRYPAAERARNSQVSVALGITGLACCLLGAAYLAALPWISPKLDFVRQDAWLAGAFVLFCGFAGVNLLTDSVFVAARIPQYNLLVDGIIQSLTKLAMPIFLVALGAAGIVTATGVGYAVAVLASVAAMRWRLGFRFDLRTRGTRLREQARFSLASYLSSLLNLVPLLVLPSIALQDLGARGAADYFMAFQIANMLNTAGHSIASAMFSEVSHDPARAGESLRRAAKLMALIVVPAAGVVVAGGGLLLAAFGKDYEQDAHTVLAILAAGSVAVAFNTWSSYAVQLAGRLRPLIASNVVFAAVTIGLAAYWGPRGLDWLGWAWGLGNLLSGLVAVVYVPRGSAVADGRARAAAAEESAVNREAGAAPAAAAATVTASAARRPLLDFDDAPTVPLILPWNTRGAARQRSSMAVRPKTEPAGREQVSAAAEKGW
jgi:O-antigen/teichoic acid export membrane protein